jgi:hypothetical protein
MFRLRAVSGARPTRGQMPGAAPDRRVLDTGFGETARDQRACGIAMQSATYAEIHTDMPTLCLDTPASAKSSLVAHPTKAFRPGMLEPQEGGSSSGAVFKCSFGVSCLYEIRCYKSIEIAVDETSTR